MNLYLIDIVNLKKQYKILLKTDIIDTTHYICLYKKMNALLIRINQINYKIDLINL